jgi:hypothetical protein
MSENIVAFYHYRISQKEMEKLKVKLQSCMENAEFVRSLKEELESKSLNYKQLENENAALKKHIEVKVWTRVCLMYFYNLSIGCSF